VSSMRFMTAAECSKFEPGMFAVNHAAGEKLSDAISQWLDPVNTNSVHYWNLEKKVSTAIHYHDFDEYWLWNKGRTALTIRLPDGRRETFIIGPGWVVYCVRGVEHGHSPYEDWGCYELTSEKREDTREGHLLRSF
jgi:mannose-6-phosphate isomerase-like protein (cupin superfamily)